jgi:hypothetical protein
MIQRKLDVILEQFASEATSDVTPAQISLFISRYPEYEAEIMDFAVDILMSKHPTEETFLDEKEKKEFLDKAIQTFRQFSKPRPVDQIAFNGINLRVNELAMEWDEFKAKTGLTKFIALSLDQKLVEVKSIPAKVVKSLSDALHIPANALMTFLQNATLSTGSMNFKSFSAPLNSEKVSFEKLVNDDLSLSESEKEMLLR